MQAARAPLNITRRGLIAAAGAVMLAPQVARAAALDSRPWLAYQDRLRARAADGGGGRFENGFSRELLAVGNAFRDAQSLPRWQWDEELATCAKAHLADMAARDYFDHQSPEGFSHVDRVSLISRDFCGGSAENLAWRSNMQTSPRDFQRMWEDSPSHRENLVRRDYDRAGYATLRVGQRIVAAAVYGSVDVRLGNPLPIRLNSSTALADVIRGASPGVQKFSLTAPFERPTWMKAPTDTLPNLTPGIWQLRPLQPIGGTRYNIVAGPIFELGA